MRKITESQLALIDSVMAEKAVGGLTEAVLEKDIHVTEALHALSAIEHQHVRLVFCGGTSLSKAHGLIERMSEDLDLKVVFDQNHGLSRTGIKSSLSGLKTLVKVTMEGLGFVEESSGSLARNENRYFASSWSYGSRYRTDFSLRPHLSLEFTVRTPQFPVSSKPVAYLVDRLAEMDGVSQHLYCVAVEETLAEKVLSFLRRHAEHRSGNMRQSWDPTLVRHIYDTYCIVQTDPATIDKAKAHFAALVAYDVEEFKRHEAFVNYPKICLLEALDLVETEDQTIFEYQTRLLPLIYGGVKPGFDEAFRVFKDCSQTLLETL